MEKTFAKKHLAWEKENGQNFAKLSANEDVAMVIYNEGGSAEGDYSGKLTLANILESTTISTLTHDNFWG